MSDYLSIFNPPNPILSLLCWKLDLSILLRGFSENFENLDSSESIENTNFQGIPSGNLTLLNMIIFNG